MANAICLLHDLCRLCLNDPGIHDILNDNTLLRDIMHCTGILNISSTDNLPRKICSSCLYKIETTKDLQRYSNNNDMYMKSFLDDSTASVHEVARPIIPLGLDRFLEDIVDSSTRKIVKSTLPDSSTENVVKSISPTVKSKISVRTTADINSSAIPLVIVQNSSEKVKHPNENSSSYAAPRKRRTQASVTTVKKEKCDMCEKSFATLRKLYMHRRSHSKNLYCPLDACGKNFYTKNDLQKHIRTHTGEKPYKCDLCEKSFTQKGTLKLHKKTVHVETM